MKTIIFAIAIFWGLGTSSAIADEFCAGFERGYEMGYMQVSGSSMEPMTPMCPMQPMKKMNDPESDYEHGMLIGLNVGYQRGSQ